jgi:hypothetical protein
MKKCEAFTNTIKKDIMIVSKKILLSVLVLVTMTGAAMAQTHKPVHHKHHHKVKHHHRVVHHK